MDLREITEQMIRTVVETPEQVGESFRGRKLARRTIGDRTLEIVFVQENDMLAVITVYWLEE